MNSILLVEDDEKLGALVSQYLSTNGFVVHLLNEGQDVVEFVIQKAPDIVILDVMLPDVDGFTLCKNLRMNFTGPLLFMTAKSESVDQVVGFELGADDYIVKPVEPRVLLARIQALLRRTIPQTESCGSHTSLIFGQLQIDKLSRQVMLADEVIELTSHEFDMLWKLAENASSLVSREVLYTELIGREYDGLDRSADVRISRLRKKLKDNPHSPYRIKTIWGKGFYFVADAWD